jgi:hypothetical protein
VVIVDMQQPTFARLLYPDDEIRSMGEKLVSLTANFIIMFIILD